LCGTPVSLLVNVNVTWLPAFTVIVSLSDLMWGMAVISTVSAAGAVVAAGAGVLVGAAVAATVGEAIGAIVGEAAFAAVGVAAGRVGLAAAGRVDVAVAFVPPPPQATDTRAAVAMTRNMDARSLLLDIGDLLLSA
jgi:hypothetical protein